jgi:molybdopterin synthase sulfur carrier subunit
MIRLVFLGRLGDLAGGLVQDVPATAPLPLATILAGLTAPLATALADDRIKLALNGVLTPRDGLVARPGDELAFLPPVSGG